MQFWQKNGAYKYSVETTCKQFNAGEKLNYTMMAEKADVFCDEKTREEIMMCNDPKLIKALGRKVHNFDETVWNQVKYSIVLNGNFMKFSQNPKLRDFLLSTGNDILVEASPYDVIWGIRMSEDNDNATNPTKWQGQNLLGFALMEVRDELRRVWANAKICEKAFCKRYTRRV